MKNFNKLTIIVSIFFALLAPSTWALSGNSWMSDMASNIGNTPLNQIFLPGTHDSATYDLESKFGKNQDITSTLNNLRYIGVGFIVTAIAKKWSEAQNLNILQQLNAGVRYLDLRVIYRDSQKAFYTVHGLYGPKLADVLQQINEFLSRNPKEIVIIQIGDLRYMPEGDRSHERLIAQIKSVLDEKIATKKDISGPTATPQQLWEKRRQAMVIYNNGIAYQDDAIWPQDDIYSYWANATDVNALKNSLDAQLNNRMTEHANQFYVVQSQLTPNTDTIKAGLNPFSSGPGSLKDMANTVYKSFSTWLEDWRSKTPNIIILDFMDSAAATKIYAQNLPAMPEKMTGCIANTCLISTNLKYAACQEMDGNFAVYNGNNRIWHINKKEKDSKFCMQSDGNLVAYSNNRSYWASNTVNKGREPYYLIMQNDGNLVIYDGSNQPIWSSKTQGK